MTPLLLPVLAACTPDLTPSWTWDPIWLEGTGPDTVHGFQTWEVFGPTWPRRQRDRFYVCAVVAELDGEVSDCDAPDCTIAWDVTPSFVETDCPDPALAENPLFGALGRLALGGLAMGDDVPWPGQTTTSYADYGDGWAVHGTAYPEAYDWGGAGDPTWTGDAPFLFTPSAAFPLP